MTARPLTGEDRVFAFRRATRGHEGSAARWQTRSMTGLNDAQLKEALEYELGIYGGSGGPGMLSIAHQGAGLKIWASWDSLNTVLDEPIFEGTSTMKMARLVYSIRNPDDNQLSFL